MQRRFKAGQVVLSSYRVAPFLVDERLVVVNASRGGRVYVQSESRPAVQGWQYADDLEVLA